VTAIYFFDDDTAMFIGKSPRGKCLPTGVRLQPLGSETLVDSSCCSVCAIEKKEIVQKKINRINFFMVVDWACKNTNRDLIEKIYFRHHYSGYSTPEIGLGRLFKPAEDTL
jgi:hypothetical protein